MPPELKASKDMVSPQYSRLAQERRIQERTKHLKDNAWFVLGLWQGPRLRKDWNDVFKAEDRHIQSMVLFFDTIYAFAVSRLGRELHDPNNQNWDGIFNWWKRFGVIMSVRLTTVDFSSRFDNDDIPFKMFWALYGIAVLGMCMHSTSGASSTNAHRFSLSAGIVYALLSLHYFRHSWLKRCRFFCCLRGVLHLGFFALGVFGFLCNEEMREKIVLVLLAGAYPLSLGLLYAGKICAWVTTYRNFSLETACRLLDVPTHVEYLVHRFFGFHMMILGQVALAIAPDPDRGYDDETALYGSICLGFVLLVTLKLFIFDVNFHEVEDHAIASTSRCKEVMWRILFPLSVGFLSLFGDAIGMLVNDSGKLENLQDERGEEGHEFASWLLAGSFSAFLIVNVLQRQLHTIPYTTLLDDSGLGGSAASLRIVHYGQSGLQAIVAGTVMLLPLLFKDKSVSSALAQLGAIATLLLILVIVNLMDEVLLLGEGSMMSEARDAIGRNKFGLLTRQNARLRFYSEEAGSIGVFTSPCAQQLHEDQQQPSLPEQQHARREEESKSAGRNCTFRPPFTRVTLVNDLSNDRAWLD